MINETFSIRQSGFLERSPGRNGTSGTLFRFGQTRQDRVEPGYYLMLLRRHHSWTTAPKPRREIQMRRA